MTKFSGFILVLLFSSTLFSQKVMERQIDISDIESIMVVANDVFHIKVGTSQTTSIQVRATVEGEYAENIVLDIKQKASVLTITPGVTPYFKKQNDKLAAHKIMAIELEMLVPENLYLSITSKIASVQCSGNFKYFQAYLNQGSCVIETFKGNGLIQTKRGNVLVKTNKDLGVLGYSKYGKIKGARYQEQYYKLEVKSVSGDITILETN